MAVVVSDTFRVMTVGRLVSVAGAAELVAVQFLCWQHFFIVFLEILGIVSMVTKNGKLHSQARLSLEAELNCELQSSNCVQRAVCSGLS